MLSKNVDAAESMHLCTQKSSGLGEFARNTRSASRKLKSGEVIEGAGVLKNNHVLLDKEYILYMSDCGDMVRWDMFGSRRSGARGSRGMRCKPPCLRGSDPYHNSNALKHTILWVFLM